MIYLSLLFTSVFITNILLVKLEGFPNFKKETKLNNILIEGIKMVVVALFTTLFVFPINKYLLISIDWDFLLPIITVLVAISVTLVTNKVMEYTKYSNEVSVVGKEFILVNSVVIAAVLLVSTNQTFLGSLVEVVGFALGHLLLTLVLFTTMPRLNAPHSPKSFKGIPLTLITVGLIAMVFMGLAGIL